jgi:hypothetical protein
VSGLLKRKRPKLECPHQQAEHHRKIKKAIIVKLVSETIPK